MATNSGLTTLQTAISLGAVFNALAAGATAETAAFTIPALTGASESAVLADLLLVGSAGITTGAGAPSLQGVILVASDGTNYPLYGLSGSQLFPYDSPYFFQINLMPGVSYSVFQKASILLPPVPSLTVANAKLVLFNNSGLQLAATVTANLYPASYGFG